MSEDLDLSVKIAMESQSFQSQISTINQKMKLVQTSFQSASSKLGDFGKVTDTLKVKAESLKQQLELQNQVVAKYAEQQTKAKETLDKNITANVQLKQKLSETIAAYNASILATGKNSEESKKLNTELTNLNKGYKDSNSTIASNVKSIDGYSIKLNTAQTSANKLDNEIGKTNTALKNNGRSFDDNQVKVKKSSTAFTDLGSKLATFSKAAVVGISALVGMGVGLAVMAQKSADSALALQRLSVSTQLSINDTQEWSYVFTKTGSSTDVMSAAINKLGTTMGKADDNSKRATEAFKDLGISVTGTGGALKPTGALFEESITKLAGMKDMTERNVIAQRLFGGSYTDLLPILNKGAAGITELKQRAHDLGLVLSNESVVAAAKYAKGMEDLKEQFTGLGVKIMNEFIPYLANMANWFSTSMPKIQEVVKIAFADIGIGVKTIAGYVTNTLVPAFNNFGKWIIPNIPAIKKYIVDMIDVCVPRFKTIVTVVGQIAMDIFPKTKKATTDLATELKKLTTSALDILIVSLTWIKNNMPLIKATVVAMTGVWAIQTGIALASNVALLAHNVQMTVKKGLDIADTGYIYALSAAQGIQTAATWLGHTAMLAFDLVMDANPIALTIIGFAALGAAILIVITHFKDICTWIQNAWDKLNIFNKTPVSNKTSTITTLHTDAYKVTGLPVNTDLSALKSNASGTNDFTGGLTTMSEKGYEIYNLPKKSKIYNHEASEDMVKKAAADVATSVLNKSNNNTKNSNINIYGNIQLQSQGDQDRTLQQLQFLSAI